MPSDAEHRPPAVPYVTPPITIQLETARLLLRPSRPSDVPELRAHLRRSAEHLRPWSVAPRDGVDPSSITMLSKAVLQQRKDWKAGQSFAFLAFSKATMSKLVARVTLNGVVRGSVQSAHLGYAVDVSAIGQGIATEAVGAVVDFAFDIVRLHRIQAAVMPNNARSLRVVDKLGFRHEGLAKGYLFIHNAWEDHEIFALTFEEWKREKLALRLSQAPDGPTSSESTASS